MVSIFGKYGGGRRGPRGLMGPKGQDGNDGLLSLITWFQPMVIDWWKRMENVSIYFETKTSGFIFGKDPDEEPIALKNFASNGDGPTVANRGAVGKVEEIESTTHFSLEFIYSVYVIEGFDFAYTVKRQAVFIISFLMEKPPPEMEVIVYSGHSRGIAIEETDCMIYISATECIKIPYRLNVWQTLYLEYNTVGESNCTINDDTKTFRIEAETIVPPPPIHTTKLGMRYDWIHHFTGKVAKIDMYSGRYEEAVPTYLKKALIKSHFDWLHHS